MSDGQGKDRAVSALSCCALPWPTTKGKMCADCLRLRVPVSENRTKLLAASRERADSLAGEGRSKLGETQYVVAGFIADGGGSCAWLLIKAANLIEVCRWRAAAGSAVGNHRIRRYAIRMR